MPLELAEILLSIVSIILLVAPTLIEKFSKLKIEKYIKLIYYFFLLISFVLGGLFKLYYSTCFFDLIVHGMFGFLLSTIIKSRVKVNGIRGLFFVIMVVVTVGFVWECLEFGSDVFVGTDHQEAISGSTDTMMDLIISVIGSLIYYIGTNALNKFRVFFT